MKPAQPTKSADQKAKRPARPARSASALAGALGKLAAKTPPAPTVKPTAAAQPQQEYRLHPERGKFREERRAYPRRVSRCIVSLCQLGPMEQQGHLPLSWHLHNSNTRGHVAEISRNGLCVTLGRPMELKEHLCLKITNPMSGRNIIANATVVRQEAAGEGKWRVMCKFDRLLEFQQVDHFGQYLFNSNLV